jgi:hypothetical protein
MSTRVPHRGAALAVAAGGVLFGHWLTYVLVSPGAAARDVLLARTGHAYLGVADELGLALTLVALSAVFLGRLTGRDGGSVQLGRLVPRLAAFQILAFLAMETAERLASGTPVGHLFHSLLLPAGFAVQAAVAVLGAALIAWMLRAAEVFATAGGASAVLPRLSRGRIVVPAQATPLRVHVSTSRGRGPPHLI